MMFRLTAALALLAAPAFAQGPVVEPCGDATRADTIAEPWEDNTASFGEGRIRVALLDMIEPAGGAFKLLIISPPHNEVGFRQCRVVQADNGLGFYNLDFAGHEASYDPERGLVLSLPAQRYTDGEPDGGWYRLSVTIDQQTGEITTGTAEE